MINLNKTLEEVKDWAREVGEIQKDNFGKQDLKISSKTTEIDLVTEVDEMSEKYIIDRIRERYPEHGILSEEAGKDKENTEYMWIIDPLDGTINYAQGLPIFAISIALQYKKETVLGVVYLPMLDEMFQAIKGEGAYLNGKRLKVNDRRDLRYCVLATGFPYDRAEDDDNNVNYFSNFVPKVKGIRRMGAAAYDLANVAAGRLDGYWELKLSIWDIAAASLMIEEAGGKIKYIPNKREHSIVAGNKDICNKIYDEINNLSYEEDLTTFS
ncbi:inositol monophosphatase family protein [Dethiothermospora halolimnae]|uniref:inositol monophosphatase family protein n=1 Tax=Dethiothermospora halolimnae TaxID=3114390 RepID=UPI003CCC2DC4